MDAQSTQTRPNVERIMKNTAFLYSNMLFRMVVMLYTSRLILLYLGVEDFGIYSVVGGIVMLFMFINNSMTVAVQRFLSFELGRKDTTGPENINKIYSIGFAIHSAIALSVFSILELSGPFILSQLNIPETRIEAAKIVFHLSTIACCIQFVQIPFKALIVATEKMHLYAGISMLDSVLRLSAVLILPLLGADNLTTFAFLTLVATSLVATSYFLCCKLRIRQYHLKRLWDKEKAFEIWRFACYSLLLELSWTSVRQGAQFILNIFFGPIINAARAVSQQVKIQCYSFSQNLQFAINPQIIKLYAANELQHMFSLTFSGIRLSFYLFFIIAYPIILNTDIVLTAWLKTYPTEASIFVKLALIESMFDVLGMVFDTVAKATGKILRYQICVSATYLLNIPLACLMFYLGYPAYWIYIIYICVSIFLLGVRLGVLHFQIGLPIGDYFRKVIARIACVLTLSLPLPLIMRYYQHDGFIGFLETSAVSIITLAIVIYFIGMTPHERQFLLRKFRKG